MSNAHSEDLIETEKGWAWFGKLSAFVGLFLTLGFLLALLMLVLEAPAPGGLLTVWSVAPLVLSALASTWFLTRVIERRPLASLGLRVGLGGAGDFALGLAIGLVLIGGVVLFFGVVGWVSWVPADEPGSWLAAATSMFALLLGAAFVEELLFRGFPFQVLLRRFGPAAAVVVTALAFGGLHAGNPNTSMLALANISLAGLLLGIAYLRTGSLWLATGVHLGWNWAMGLSELSVSGLPEFGVPGIEAIVSGPSLWTGGAFGPEGGLAVTISSILGTFWLWRLGRRDVNLSALSSELAVPEAESRGFHVNAVQDDARTDG